MQCRQIQQVSKGCYVNADASLLLDEACHQVLTKYCVGLSRAAGPSQLVPPHLQPLCSLTELKLLELELIMSNWASSIKHHPALPMPQGFTHLTSLHSLTALSFPALPSGFSSPQRLSSLYLAPTC
ncbi:hypothetical protein ABBQ32_010527 [Trebouxia sp. C0010 RCD-2024]